MSFVPAIHPRSEYVLETKVAGVQSRHNYHKFSHSSSCHIGSPLKIITNQFSKYSMQSLLRAPANSSRMSASESCFHFDSFFHSRVVSGNDNTSDGIKSTNRKEGNLSKGLSNLLRDLIPFHRYNMYFNLLRCQIFDVIDSISLQATIFAHPTSPRRSFPFA